MKYSYRRRLVRAMFATIAIPLVGMIAGCGGEDDTPAGGGSAPASVVISGAVIDGPVRGATVKAFQVIGGIPSDTPLATATTAADGSYQLELPAGAADFVLMISATGGEYCAGSSSAQVSDGGTCSEGMATPMDVPLVTVTNANEGEHYVTPISTAAALTATSLHIMEGGIVHVLEGSVTIDGFSGAYGMLTGGASPDDSLDAQQSLLSTVVSMQTATDLAGCISHIQAGLLKGAVATAPQASFSIKQGGMIQNLNGNEDDTAAITGIDPTLFPPPLAGNEGRAFVDYSLTFLEGEPVKWWIARAAGESPAAPFFQPRDGIDVDTLVNIMEDDSVLDVAPHAAVIVNIGGDQYRGYKLADVVERATKFRPRDASNAGIYGPTTAIVAWGTDGRVATFSFSELIRTENGEKTIVAFEKNGAPLDPSEGTFAVIAGNDNDPWLRKVPRLKELHVRNDFLPGDGTLPNAENIDVSFTVTGAVQNPTKVTAATLSTASSQGYYAVDKVGTKAVSEFPAYYFQNYGPRHTNYWWGQGIQLKDVLDTAGLQYPDDKGACFVVIRSRNNIPALFSCGELYNSRVGVGDGQSGSENRSRSKGVVLVTDDFRRGSSSTTPPFKMMMACWSDIDSCTKNDPGNVNGYAVVMDSNSDSIGDEFIALISTEDTVPFSPLGRWFPKKRQAYTSRDATDLPPLEELDEYCTVDGCLPWIDVGERMQQGITSLEVIYAAGTGNGTRGVPGAGAGTGGGHMH